MSRDERPGAGPLPLTPHRALEVSAVLAFWALSLLLAIKVLRAAQGPAGWGLAALSAALGYLGADFVSGLVHWMGDRFGTEETPLLGPNFIRPFREHHVDPEGITRHDFFETNGNNCIVALPVLASALGLEPVLPGAAGTVLLPGCALFLCLSVFATNQFHKWAHMESPPALAAFLQRRGLILAREHHAVHHASPYDTYYCITNGWLNPLLARLRFFERLEELLRRTVGLETSPAFPAP